MEGPGESSRCIQHMYVWCCRDGLVHKSQLSSEYVNTVDEAVAAGQTVWVKVVEITEDPQRGQKIGLSMAVVSQVCIRNPNNRSSGCTVVALGWWVNDRIPGRALKGTQITL